MKNILYQNGENKVELFSGLPPRMELSIGDKLKFTTTNPRLMPTLGAEISISSKLFRALSSKPVNDSEEKWFRDLVWSLINNPVCPMFEEEVAALLLRNT